QILCFRIDWMIVQFNSKMRKHLRVQTRMRNLIVCTKAEFLSEIFCKLHNVRPLLKARHERAQIPREIARILPLLNQIAAKLGHCRTPLATPDKKWVSE